MKLIKKLSLYLLIATMGVPSAHADWRDVLNRTHATFSGLYGNISSKINTGYVATTGIGIAVACGMFGFMYQFGSKSSRKTVKNEQQQNLPFNDIAQLALKQYEANLPLDDSNVLRLPTQHDLALLKTYDNEPNSINSAEPVLTVQLPETEKQLLPLHLVTNLVVAEKDIFLNNDTNLSRENRKLDNANLLGTLIKNFRENPAVALNPEMIKTAVGQNIIKQKTISVTYNGLPGYSYFTYENGSKAYSIDHDLFKLYLLKLKRYYKSTYK